MQSNSKILYTVWVVISLAAGTVTLLGIADWKLGIGIFIGYSLIAFSFLFGKWVQRNLDPMDKSVDDSVIPNQIDSSLQDTEEGNEKKEATLEVSDAVLEASKETAKSEIFEDSFNISEVLSSYIKIAVDEWLKIYDLGKILGYDCDYSAEVYCVDENGKKSRIDSSDNNDIPDIGVRLEYTLRLMMSVVGEIPKRSGVLYFNGEFEKIDGNIVGAWKISDLMASANFGDEESLMDWATGEGDHILHIQFERLSNVVEKICESIRRRFQDGGG